MTHTPTPGMSAFTELFTPFLADLFALDPVFATEIGDHARDSEWPDLSETGRLAVLAFIEQWSPRFEVIEGLTSDDAVDRDLVLGRLAAMRFDAETLRDDATDPMTWIYLLGSGLDSVMAHGAPPTALLKRILAG